MDLIIGSLNKEARGNLLPSGFFFIGALAATRSHRFGLRALPTAKLLIRRPQGPYIIATLTIWNDLPES
ncbi:MAG: hypothetical protein RSD68_02980, partial [Oscillospiraceae bacterium]